MKSDGCRAVGDLIGYARVSTTEQNATLQLDALQAAGCERALRRRAARSPSGPSSPAPLITCGPATRSSMSSAQHTIAEIAATLGVSRASIYRSLDDTAAGPG